MSILLNNQGYENQPWVDAFSRLLPNMHIDIYPDVADAEAILYAVIWNHPHGDILNYPNLRAILLLGAGTEHIEAEPKLPDVPVVPLIDPAVGNDMAQYVSYWAIHFLRDMESYRQQQTNKIWRRLARPSKEEFPVLVLGSGRIGRFIADRLRANGFKVSSWSRSAKTGLDYPHYHGQQGLLEAIKSCKILVNCLPLNTQTRQLINEDFLQNLQDESYLISVSRGGVVDQDALIRALDDGRIAAAALDVLVDEPLAEDSILWAMKNVYITPHMSGATYANPAAEAVAENILRLEAGKPAFPLHNMGS